MRGIHQLFLLTSCIGLLYGAPTTEVTTKLDTENSTSASLSHWYSAEDSDSSAEDDVKKRPVRESDSTSTTPYTIKTAVLPTALPTAIPNPAPVNEKKSDEYVRINRDTQTKTPLTISTTSKSDSADTTENKNSDTLKQIPTPYELPPPPVK